MTFWVWWLRPEHTVDGFRFTTNCVFLFWTTVIPGYFVAIAWRARVPHPARSVPAGLRVAMVVTKAPSEPFEIVEKTLVGMLNQTYPHDTWLADEDPSAETIAWCAHHGVRLSTRKGVTAYHNASWPRRTKCKEGNLAYFYDRYGYEGYEFVSQLDADHVPTATYLEEMLRPFADRQVGYVSAPSICDSNRASSWSARGRLYNEGPFHGVLQAGYSGGLAPLCIGSHYAVRTAALREIGGLGPELAEDHSTTLMMNAKGWRGVHALDAIAHGEGPRTFADMATQEYQWSRSLMLILLRYTRHYYAPLPLRLKAQFLFCQLWYTLFSLSMVAACAIPAVALWTHKVWAHVDYVTYFLHTSPIVASLVALMAWLRKTGSFRPYDAKLVTWEGVLFLFARWPWDLFGTLSAISDRIRGREFSFRVTAKGDVTEKQVPLRLVMPYLLISLFCGIPVLAVRNAQAAGGFYVFSIVSCLTYLLIAIVIVVAHNRERGQRTASIKLLIGNRSLARNLLFSVAITVALSGLALRFTTGIQAMMWRPATAHERVAGHRAATEPVLGVYDPNHDFSEADDLAIEQIFVSWSDADAMSHILQSYDYATRRNRWLMIAIEPWPAAGRARSTLLADIGRGTYDPEIHAICKGMAELNAPLFVRWGHEMETSFARYPWAGNAPALYIGAYRHFVDQCRRFTSKLLYVWSPAGDPNLDHYFPGRPYADYIGLSVYDCPHCNVEPAGGAYSVASIFREKYRRVQRYDRPVMIAELGVDGEAEYKRKEIDQLLATLWRYPLLRSVFYFDARDTPGAWPTQYVPDWRVDPAFFRLEGG
ncbi:glycosyltransferase family 2 protein [Burkholderia sp. Ac-20353]|uniref:glycosyltransferase family 2 protein n=1 Tax=Burkholderia sp. Ac-20353 TaxID=2703894 RepID=UPI00197B4A28|nr:glycosyltransferase family 2 protein [Burkholderia sp. Ac-20353]MBN3789614.1 glycosyltransferase [Burkholderia sp. Ac-20353]